MEPILVNIPIICNALSLDPQSTYTDSTQRKSHDVNLRKKICALLSLFCKYAKHSSLALRMLGCLEQIFLRRYITFFCLFYDFLWDKDRKFFGATWRDVATSRKSAQCFVWTCPFYNVFNFLTPDGLQTGPSLSWANRPPPRGVRSGDSVKVWQLTPEFYPLFFLGKKIIDGPGHENLGPSLGKNTALLWSFQQFPRPRSRTYEGLFELTRLPKLQEGLATERCVALGAVVPGHQQI